MMRRPGMVGLDVFQLHGLQHAGLALHLFFEKLDELVLAGHDLVQLLDLMFEVGDAGFKFFEPLKDVFVHAGNGSQFSPIRQTTSAVAYLCRAQNATGISKAVSAMETGSNVIGSA
jgi:hypothetical protein